MMKFRIAQFLTHIFFVLVVGVFWGTWFSLSRSIADFTPGAFLEIGKVIIHNLAGPMRILMPGAVLLSIVTLVLFPDKKSFAFYFTLVGAILMVVSMIITLSVNVPIDNRIKLWTLDSIPSDWGRIRDHWERFHTLRTFVSLAGLASLLLGTLKSK